MSTKVPTPRTTLQIKVDPKVRSAARIRAEQRHRTLGDHISELVTTDARANGVWSLLTGEATSAHESLAPASNHSRAADRANKGLAKATDTEPTEGEEQHRTAENPTMVDIRKVLALFDAPLLHPGMRMNPFDFSLLGDVESRIQDLRHQVQDQQQLLAEIAECLGCDRVDGALLEEIRALKRAPPLEC